MTAVATTTLTSPPVIIEQLFEDCENSGVGKIERVVPVILVR